MATRVAYAGTAAAGDVYTAANHARMPGGSVASVEVTANQTGITGVADLTNLTLTFTAVANRRYRITCKIEVQTNTANDVATLSLTDGSNNQQQRANIPMAIASNDYTAMIVHEEQPSAGSIVRKLRLQRTAGTGTLQMTAAATRVAYIYIEDIGPSYA